MKTTVFLSCIAIAFMTCPPSAAFVGRVFEAPGTRAVREAEAESLRTEAEISRLRAELDAERQRALLAGSTGARREPSGTPINDAILFFVACAATVGFWRELRAREKRESEIRELRFRLALAERGIRPSASVAPAPEALLAWRADHGE